jgi:hypothetical protein
MDEDDGWFAYVEAEPGIFGESGGFAAVTVDGRAGSDDRPFELADLRRLGRRAARTLVRIARADERPTLSRILADHLGPAPVRSTSCRGPGPTTTTSTSSGHRHVVDRPGARAPARRGARLPAPLVRPGRACWEVRTQPGQCGPGQPSGRTRRRARVRTLRRLPRHRGGHPHGPAGQGRRPRLRYPRRDRAVREHRPRARRTGRVGGACPGAGAQRVPPPGAVVWSPDVRVRPDARHKERMLASGQHLKRGVLLRGPPGVGKTHTVRFLMSRLTDTTVVQVTGESVGMLSGPCFPTGASRPVHDLPDACSGWEEQGTGGYIHLRTGRYAGGARGRSRAAAPVVGDAERQRDRDEAGRRPQRPLQPVGP